MPPKKSKRKKQKPVGMDKYDLYQRSVQDPPEDVKLLGRIFRGHFGRPPRVLREDFCGTAALACEWVRRHAENRAWGVDLDPEPIAWGHEHNVSKLGAKRQARVTLVEGDVREVLLPRVDITCAFNFSYFLFKTRDELRNYFEVARTTLRREGLLALDVYGGADAMKRMTETREIDGFDYVWDQDRFDPITHEVENYIHFVKPGRGGRMDRAFTYHWRLWSIPELRELLGEAGFRRTEVYWEGTDTKTNEGNGIFTKREHAPDDPAWIAYLIAIP